MFFASTNVKLVHKFCSAIGTLQCSSTEVQHGSFSGIISSKFYTFNKSLRSWKCLYTKCSYSGLTNSINKKDCASADG